MSTLEYRVVLEVRDLDDKPPKWKRAITSRVFGKSTLADYDGLAIRVDLETIEDRIRRNLAGNWP
jgi:hypothetical protein